MQKTIIWKKPLTLKKLTLYGKTCQDERTPIIQNNTKNPSSVSLCLPSQLQTPKKRLWQDDEQILGIPISKKDAEHEPAKLIPQTVLVNFFY